MMPANGAIASTPGAWTVHVRDSGMGSIVYIKADTGHYEVAVLYPNGERQIADAHLIATAPRMLALAEEFISWPREMTPADIELFRHWFTEAILEARGLR